MIRGHGQGSLVRGHWLEVKGHWLVAKGHWSEVRGHWSAKGHWSKVTGQTIFYHQTLYESDPAEGLEVMRCSKALWSTPWKDNLNYSI